jgi:hypothetical protein
MLPPLAVMFQLPAMTRVARTAAMPIRDAGQVAAGRTRAGAGETAAPTRDRARPHTRLTPTPGAPLVAAPAGQTPTGTRRTMEQPAEQTAGALRP